MEVWTSVGMGKRGSIIVGVGVNMVSFCKLYFTLIGILIYH